MVLYELSLRSVTTRIKIPHVVNVTNQVLTYCSGNTPVEFYNKNKIRAKK